jgi:NADH-quinone oxidoreductase subunit N
MSSTDFLLLSPFIIVGLGGLAVLLVGVLPVARPRRPAYALTVALLLVSALLALALRGHERVIEGMIIIDPVSLSFMSLAAAGALATVLLARHYAPTVTEIDEAFHGLVLFATLGMFILVASADLLAGFLGLELISVPLFGLIAWHPHRPGAIEGGLKYAVLSGLAAAFFLYGMSLIYAGCGTLEAGAIAAAMAGPRGMPPLVTVGTALLLAGIAFELAVVPFHMWTADIYQGGPVPVTALLGAVAKVAMLVFLSRLVGEQMVPVWAPFLPLLAGLAAAGMVVGNLLALRQRNLKRLLGYSTVAHFGYILAALASGTQSGYHAALYYGLAYAVMNMAVFGVVAVLARQDGDREDLLAYRGLGRRHPWLGLVLAIGVLSLAGLPPTAGFFAKLFVFLAALQAGLQGLAVLLALATAASFYYYLRILVVFFSPAAEEEAEAVPAAQLSFGSGAVLASAALLTLGVGVYARLFV